MFMSLKLIYNRNNKYKSIHYITLYFIKYSKIYVYIYFNDGQQLRNNLNNHFEKDSTTNILLNYKKLLEIKSIF